MAGLTTAGPTISRGDFYGGDEGHFSAVSESSGPDVAGPSPALFWIAALGLLIAIRLVWESAD